MHWHLASLWNITTSLCRMGYYVLLCIYHCCGTWNRANTRHRVMACVVSSWCRDMDDMLLFLHPAGCIQGYRRGGEQLCTCLGAVSSRRQHSPWIIEPSYEFTISARKLAAFHDDWTEKAVLQRNHMFKFRLTSYTVEHKARTRCLGPLSATHTMAHNTYY